jgi:hypothetical protein
MPETHDLSKTGLFISHLRYPKVFRSRRLPRSEFPVSVREYEGLCREGVGLSIRIPFTRLALIIGAWIDSGGDQDKRIREILGAKDLEVDKYEIKTWS